MNNKLASKVALITGAARRIGAEIAHTLHDASMNIVLHYHTSEKEAKALCATLNEKRPNSAVILQADLEIVSNCQQLVQNAYRVWQRLDVLVNNASQFYKTKIGEVSETDWVCLFDSNIRAPFFLSQAAAQYLSAVKGVIINITDIHAEYPLREYSVYCLSKSSLAMMTKVLAKELGPNIRVNAVAPGAIIWPEGENILTEEEKKSIINHTSLMQPGHPKDIAKAVLFFVRDADYITGQTINVDGGRT